MPTHGYQPKSAPSTTGLTLGLKPAGRRLAEERYGDMRP